MMSRVPLWAAVVCALSFAARASAQLPADDKPEGTATIRGRVTDAATGRPLRRARVNLFPADFTPNQRIENRSASTDAEGRYEFTALVAARYSISAIKSGYTSWSYGQGRLREGGKPIQIADKQTLDRVDIALPPGTTVTGRVVDEFGDPAEDVSVSLLRYVNAPGGRRLSPFTQSQTNDAGEFRLSSVQPGQYYVAASAHAMTLPPDIAERVGWARTFYPSATDVGQARRITLGMGQAVSDVVIALVPMRPVRISGTAFSAQGRPLTGNVSAMRRGEMFMGGQGGNGPIRPDGTFVINGLSPGDYTLMVNGPPTDGGETASADITIGDDDLENVAIVSMPPLTGTGRVVIDPAATGSLPANLRVGADAAPVNGASMNFGPSLPPAPVNGDLTFEVKSRPGMRRFNIMNLPPGWRIRAVRQGTTDVTDKGVEFRPGGRVSDVEIELTNVTTTITGTVKTTRGDVSLDYTVAFILQDREKWSSRSPRSVRPNQLGEFRISGLPAGDYYVVAFASVDYEDFGDPDFLEKAVKEATRMTLADGETKSLDLRLARTP